MTAEEAPAEGWGSRAAQVLKSRAPKESPGAEGWTQKMEQRAEGEGQELMEE
jgi:hypothetical protein